MYNFKFNLGEAFRKIKHSQKNYTSSTIHQNKKK